MPDHTPATKGVLGAGAFGKVFKAGFGINGTWGPGVGITDMQNEFKKKKQMWKGFNSGLDPPVSTVSIHMWMILDVFL